MAILGIFTNGKDLACSARGVLLGLLRLSASLQSQLKGFWLSKSRGLWTVSWRNSTFGGIWYLNGCATNMEGDVPPKVELRQLTVHNPRDLLNQNPFS